MSGLIVGLVGAGIGATTAGLSFAQAGRQRRLMQEAEIEADRALEAARAKLEVNYMEQVAIQKEPYEQQREQALQATATALEGVREGEARGAAAGVGRIAMANQQLTNQQRAAMSKELQGLEIATAQEDSRLRDIGIQLDLGEVQGAQQAASDAQAASAAAMQQGMTSAAGALQSAISTIPLYQQNNAQQQQALAAAGTEGLTADQQASLSQATLGKTIFGKERGSAFGADGFSGEAVGGMSRQQFRQFKRNLSGTDQAALFNRQSFTDNLFNIQNPTMASPDTSGTGGGGGTDVTTTDVVTTDVSTGTGNNLGMNRGQSYVENGITFVWDAKMQQYMPQ